MSESAGIMWPMRLEMTRDECRKHLRYLELEAYGSMVSVLRAQGPFTSEKQKLLQELAKILHISNERHRAEIRRAVNDEKLATVAEQLNGPNTGIDWTIEGRRTIPLLPRLRAQNAFTTLANSLSLATATANKKKPDRRVVTSTGSNPTVTENTPRLKIEAEDSSVDVRLCSPENELDNKVKLQNSNLAEEQTIDNKNVIERDTETPKAQKIPEKRKASSPIAPPSKVLVVSSSSFEALNHTVVDEKDVQIPRKTTDCQNVTLISSLTRSEISDSKETTLISTDQDERALVSSNQHINTAISVCESNIDKPKILMNTVQNKISTKVVPAVVLDGGSDTTLKKVQSENKDAQSQDNKNSGTDRIIDNTQKTQMSENASSNSFWEKSSIMHLNSMYSVASKPVISSSTHRILAVHPNTTVSSGPGPPQVKQASPILAYTKLPSLEQTATINQPTAKMSVINYKKAVNIPHQSNTKLTKTNLIVIQKGHGKGVKLSHAGKDILGKVIVGGKNLCVANQHNASSFNILPHISLNGDQTTTTLPTANSSNAESVKSNIKHNASSINILPHISLNGDQTTTMLPIANSSNAESVKTNIKSGNTIVFNLQDVLENKTLSQRFASSGVLNSEPKTALKRKFWDATSRISKEESDANANTDSAITSTESKEHRKSKNIDASMNSQVTNPLDSSKTLGVKEINVRLRQLDSVQDNTEDDGRIENTNEETDACVGTLLDSADTNMEDLQYLETVAANHVHEYEDDS